MKAALFVHGFMGTGRQFDFLMDAPALTGYAPHVLTLAGHGGTLDAFVRHGRDDWQRCLDDKLAELKGRYDSIHIIGHSMGGLLAIDAAARDPRKIERITALALPLRIRLSARGIGIRIRALAAPRASEACEIRAAREMCGVEGLTLLRAPRLLPNSLALLAVIRGTRGTLGTLRVPLTVVQSRHDELVSRRALSLLRKAVPTALTAELPESSHFWYSERDKQAMWDILAGKGL